MRAFIIRPFGKKQEVNFDEVEDKLIGPALAQLGIEGRTTIDIMKQGNIRMDMFQRLLTADLVIADLSIHNANVFYELGIRHALRDKRTFLLRARINDFPFDLQTDRYFAYDKDNPAATLDKLVVALRQTLLSEDQDSPVFRLLPDLKVQDRSRLLAVPLDFREAVERAEAEKQLGDLELLGEEAMGFEWESEGLRLVGRSQFMLKAYEGAHITWEAVRAFDSMDLEANTTLGTIYQRLNDLTRSDQALQRVLSVATDPYQRAEAQALLGRNAKARWKADWQGLSTEQQPQQALRSPFLQESLDACHEGFREDLNHFYSGLNALAMLTVQTELAAALPEVWAERFERDADAPRELGERQEQVRKLAAAVELSLRAAKIRLEREHKKDVWVEISEADLACLTSNRSSRVANLYRDALANARDFNLDSVHDQLMLYQQLGVLNANVLAALAVFPPAAGARSSNVASEKPKRIVLFTGHRIDATNRDKPRFPSDKEQVARQKIKDAVSEELNLPGGVAYGLAGGASGGDILFHEVCAELGIPTKLYLALPRDQFLVASVQSAGPNWVERFDRLQQQLPGRVLADSKKLPRWLSEKANYSVWQRNNLWLLHHAMAAGGGSNVCLIALWNGEAGDGPGGTADMVQKARERGAKTVILDAKKLFGL
jgi:hypothetical protein